MSMARVGLFHTDLFGLFEAVKTDYSRVNWAFIFTYPISIIPFLCAILIGPILALPIQTQFICGWAAVKKIIRCIGEYASTIVHITFLTVYLSDLYDMNSVAYVYVCR